MTSPVPTSYLRYQNGTWGPDLGPHPGRYIRIPQMGIRSKHTMSTDATLPRLNLGSHQALPQFRGVNKTFTPSAHEKSLQVCKCSFWILHVYIVFFLAYISPDVKFCKVVYILWLQVLTSSIYSPTLTFINTLYTENPGRSHHGRTSSPLHPSPAAGCTIVAVHL